MRIFVFIYGDLDCYRAVLAEELWECEAKKPLHKLLWIGLSDKGKRWLELRGHEINVQVAVALYHKSEQGYRYKEALALTRYKGFEDLELEQIIEQMKAVKQFAIIEARNYIK